MRGEYEAALKSAYWICAQNLYKSLLLQPPDFLRDYTKKSIREAVQKSGRSFSELEPNGGFFDDEDLKNASPKEQHMISARHCLREIGKAEQPSKDYARSLVPVMRDHLAKAGKKLSDLFNGCSEKAAVTKLEFMVALAENNYLEKTANPRR
jgi:hypothetical protein